MDAMRFYRKGMSVEVVRFTPTGYAMARPCPLCMAELKKHGVFAEFPIKSDTESLLNLEELKHPRLNRILIVKGEGGRDLLEKTLIEMQ